MPGAGGLAQTTPAPNVVTEWSRIIQPTIHNSAAPRTPVGAFILHTLVQLAVYDAVVAIEGGFEPSQTTRHPEGGCGTDPNDVKTAQVVLYTFTDPAQFRPGGPPALASGRWATDSRK